MTEKCTDIVMSVYCNSARVDRFEHYSAVKDVQTLAMLSCQFWTRDLSAVMSTRDPDVATSSTADTIAHRVSSLLLPFSGPTLLLGGGCRGSASRVQ